MYHLFHSKGHRVSSYSEVCYSADRPDSTLTDNDCSVLLQNKAEALLTNL